MNEKQENSENATVAAGIDLGTTNSVIAVLGEYPDKGFVFGPVTVLWDEYQRLTHASAVCQVDGVLMVGEEAKLMAAEGYSPVRFVKKFMGTQEKFRVGEEEWSAPQVSAAVLRHMINIAQRALGNNVKIRSAVVTYPAYFDSLAIDATQQAGSLADLNVKDRLMMEPVAAAMAYTHKYKQPKMRVLIYDLGGGTFDITLVDRVGGTFRPITFGGDRELGGYNFDKRIAGRILNSLREKGYVLNIDANRPERDPRWASLMHHAELLKIKLSEPGAKKANVHVPGAFKDDSTPRKAVQLSFSLSIKEFLELIEPEVLKTIRATQKVLEQAQIIPEGTTVIDETLKEKIRQTIDFLVLVGGSSRIPAIQERLLAEFGLEPQFDEEIIDLSVAIGAAMVASTMGAEEGGVFLQHVPETTDRTKLTVSGRIVVTDAVPDVEGFTVSVSVGDEEPVERLTGQDGKFFFEVALIENIENQVELRVEAPDGSEFFRRNFVVLQDKAQPPPPPPPRQVLSKPISVTSDTGFFQVAAEGSSLPLETKHAFFTTDELDQISIEFYQEDMPLGELILKDFGKVPPNTRGELETRIATDFSMEMTASVPSVNIRKTQKIKLVPPPISETAELIREFRQLQIEYRSLLENAPDGDVKARIAAECDRIVEENEELVKQEHAERIQLYQNNRRFFLLLKQMPVVTLFDPTKPEMAARFAKARALLADRIQKEPAIADQQFGQNLDALEREAERLYHPSTCAEWKQVGEAVKKIINQLLPPTPPPPPLPPPQEMKREIDAEIREARSLLSEKQQSHSITPDVAVECGRDLDLAVKRTNAVDLSQGDRASQQLLAIYFQVIKPVLDRLGGETGPTKRKRGYEF